MIFGRHQGAISKQLLASLQLLLALCMLVPKRWYEHLRAAHSPLKDTAVGSLVGGVSTLIGVGGGTYTMFYFLVHGRQIKDCTLTSNVVGIYIGLMSIVGYYGATRGVATFAGPHAIDGLGKAILVAAGVAASAFGVRLQPKLPAAAIRKLVVPVRAVSSSYVLLST